MEKYYDENRYEDSGEDEGCGCGGDNGSEENQAEDIHLGKRRFDVVEKRYDEHPKPRPKLKRPCRCGGHKFVEPKMKHTNCIPKDCEHGPDYCCIPCHCECDR